MRGAGIPSAHRANLCMYDWVLSRAEGEAFVQRHGELLRVLPSRARILDCSCGIGVDAVALVDRGYDVWAADASAEMVAVARMRAGKSGAVIPIARCDWVDLPEMFEEPFDLVRCCGSSIGRCRGEAEMVQALTAMCRVLKGDGRLVVDSYNWEKLCQERPRFTLMEAGDREGKRYFPLYVWDFPEKWEEPHTAEVVLIFEEDDKTWCKAHGTTFYPFRAEELMNRVNAAGLTFERTDYEEARPFYSVIARRSSY